MPTSFRVASDKSSCIDDVWLITHRMRQKTRPRSRKLPQSPKPSVPASSDKRPLQPQLPKAKLHPLVLISAASTQAAASQTGGMEKMKQNHMPLLLLLLLLPLLLTGRATYPGEKQLFLRMLPRQPPCQDAAV